MKKSKNKGPATAPASSLAPAGTTAIVCTIDEIVYPAIPGFRGLTLRRGNNDVPSDHLDALIDAGFGRTFERHLSCGYLEFASPKSPPSEAAAAAVTETDEDLIAKIRSTFDLQLLDSVFHSSTSQEVQNACIKRSSELDSLPQSLPV